MKICVVDDEKQVRLSIMHKLETLFPTAQVFDGEFGRSALDKIRLVQPDLIFMDIRMPEMDGLEILRSFKPMYPAAQVVILSGYEDFEYARQALQLGAMDYLLKPADREELRKVVEKANLEMQNIFNKDMEVFLGRLSGEYIFIHDMRCYNTSLWFDERQTKELRFGDSEMLLKQWEAAPEQILVSFSINHDYGGIIVRTAPGQGGFVFHTKEQLLSALSSGIVKWESDRFFGGDRKEQSGSGIKPKDAARQAVRLRQEILAYAKVGNYEQMKASLDEWLLYLEDLEYVQLKKECVNLMALLDEGLARNEVLVLEEEKLHYWWQWAAKHKTWDELKGKIRKFVLDGVRALILLENQPILNWFEQALHFVDTSRDPNLSLESVAEAVGVHPVTLSRIFKQQTGMNFVKYIVQRRLRDAKSLLLTTDKNINDISEEIGYMDHRYFRSLFKKEFGITPSEYRKRNGSAAAIQEAE